jgi:hypothetical protein
VGLWLVWSIVVVEGSQYPDDPDQACGQLQGKRGGDDDRGGVQGYKDDQRDPEQRKPKYQGKHREASPLPVLVCGAARA